MPNDAGDGQADREGALPARHDPAQLERCRPERLQRRADFLHVGKGRRWHGRAMTVQMSPRRPPAPVAEAGAGASLGPGVDGPPRFGFTLTKKVGNAVVRNRARRRLREAVRLSSDLPARPGHDYVVVGRLDAIRLPFAELLGELVQAVERVHDAGAARPGARRPRRRS